MTIMISFALIFLSSGLQAAPLNEKVAELVSHLKNIEGCRIDTAYQTSVLKKARVLNSKGKKAALIYKEIENDLSLIDCDIQSSLVMADLLTAISQISSEFPLSIFEVAFTKEAELAQDHKALEFIKKQEDSLCLDLPIHKRAEFSAWHELIIESGWPCVVKNYQAHSDILNSQRGYEFKVRQVELSQLSLKETKDLFKKTFKNESLAITFFPQLGWENGVVNTTFPYTLITDKTELTSYRFLQKEFRKLGMRTKLISRNTVAPLNEQVRESLEQLETVSEKQIVISRSMGSRVVRELMDRHPEKANQSMKAWINVGGTPHGSFIASYKSQRDHFHAGHLPQILEAFNAPLRLMARDPRIPNHLFDTVLEAHRRESLETLSAVKPGPLKTNIPIFNAVFLRSDYVRATSGVDPVWREMLLYGASEGSAPLNGAAVEAENSLNLIESGDHLSFWAMDPKEALKLYLRYLILSREQGQI